MAAIDAPRSAVALTIGIAFLGALLPGCGRLHAPESAVPSVEDAGEDPFGGWATITLVEGEEAPRTRTGELLAVSRDTVWLMGDDGAEALPVERIEKAEVTGYDSDPGRVVTLSMAGALSTISNGAFLILTGPLWILTGSIASIGQAKASRVVSQGDGLSALSLYARFPQGMPQGLDPATLRSARPWKVRP